MINITRWSPDTCKCVIEYSWDSELSEDDRTHDFHKVVNKCPDHDGIEDHEEVHDHVKSENQSKNLVVAQLLENVPRLKKQDGLDPSVEFKWEFEGKDKERQLRVRFDNASLTKAERIKLAQSIATLNQSITLD